MNLLAKYFFLAAGIFAATLGVFNENIAAGIVAAGSFIAFTIMEAVEFKQKK